MSTHLVRRNLARGVSLSINNILARNWQDDFETLGPEVLAKLLMLSFTGVAVDMRYAIMVLT